MSELRFRNDVLNPCPTCGKRFDLNGCMTFVGDFLEKLHSGKCPACGTQVVIRVSDPFQPEIWEQATTLPEIRTIAMEKLDLSVRTRISLRKLNITTIGDLLDSSEATFQQGLAVPDSVIDEIRRLLATKGLSIKRP